MKNKTGNAKKTEKMPDKKRKTKTEMSDQPDTAEEKKIVVVPFKEPTRLYFSPPCMLSEMEDDEDFLNL